MRIGSLFSGIGGFDLGLERAGHKVIWQSEIDPYACRVLKKHWPDVPNLGDITAIDWSGVERPDCVCGGFPCQDISVAGKGAGIEGKRSGLWTEFARCIREIRPSFVVVENVSDLLVRGLDVVLGTLARLGFDAEWSIVSACSMGAPHTRERMFIVCNSLRGRFGRNEWRQYGPLIPSRLRWATEPGICRVGNGIPNRVDRIRTLGNAVVPQVAEWIGHRLNTLTTEGTSCSS